MTVKITGGSELRARLSAISAPFREIGGKWQSTASGQMRATAPSRTGHLRGSIRPASLTDKFASIDGDYWALFIDRGTKAHDIAPRKGHKALKFEQAGDTIFARKVHHRRTRRRPFVTQAAVDALATWRDTFIGLWNRKRATQRWRISK